jgi:hypothetical protein
MCSAFVNKKNYPVPAKNATGIIISQAFIFMLQRGKKINNLWSLLHLLWCIILSSPEDQLGEQYVPDGKGIHRNRCVLEVSCQQD